MKTSFSVGSLGAHGAHETVEEVHVQNCNFTGTMNGARIKTWQVIKSLDIKNKKLLKLL